MSSIYTKSHDLVGQDGRQVTESRLTLNEVNRGIQQLSADQQVLIALVCVDGLSYKEAADVLDLPIGTVMSRLARARRALYIGIHGVAKPLAEPAEGRRGRPDG